MADHGQEALQLSHTTTLNNDQPAPVQSKPISIIFIDLKMPVMDDITCVRNIRSLHNSKKFRDNVLVVAATAKASIDQLKWAKEQGMARSGPQL